ncbi:hypothetical protein BH23BAC1_BH23BAC1_07090 [soil metagenome]
MPTTYFTYFIKIPFSFFKLIFLLVFLFTAGCGDKPITEVNMQGVEFAHFVEPEFPFITTSLDARNLGPGFPENNIAARVLALQLGNEAYACFDTDLLRWSVAWTGDFMPMVTMAQISYNDFFNKDNKLPVIGGDPKIATGLYAGWTVREPQFSDPRPAGLHPDAPSWGPLPQNIGRWNGLYLQGRETVLAYTVGDMELFEKPGSIKLEEETGFTRTFQIAAPKEALTMVAAEITNGTRSEINGKVAYIYHQGDDSKVTAIGLAGDMDQAEIEVIDNRYAVVKLSPGSQEMNFTTIMWQGAADKKGVFEQMLSEKKSEMPDFRTGGTAHWKETVLTRGQLSPDTAAYVTDQLTLPIPNPWNRNVRVVDLVFLENNNAALVTFEGDVWMVEGIDHDLGKLKWRRYASGLYEPQSIEVVDSKIYVYGKEGIVRLHDLNGDGVADFYENFSNIMVQSIETREWASDMVLAPDGSFYVAKFGSLDMGPETSSPKNLMGFRAASPHDGSILKISADGRSMKTIATGFRGPYLGINPKTGVLSASDQQGHYMPSTPVMLVNKGDYYGVPATAHLEKIPEVTPPLTWIPHSVDRSGISQVWINSDRMGPLNGEMVHISYGRPGLFRVMIDSTRNGVQGGIALLPGHYPAPTMKGAINPKDGQLYITGFSLWGSNSENISAFIRIRYTGKEFLAPDKAYIREGGVVIRFNNELDEATVKDVNNYQVKRWNYQRAENYGSGHFKLDGTPGEENLTVLESHLSDDKKVIFLAVPNMEEVMQMEVSYQLKTANGSVMEDELWFTVNNLEKPNLLAEGFSNLRTEDLVFAYDFSMENGNGEEISTAGLGEQIFSRAGCIACHAIDEQKEGKLGPGLRKVYGSERHFEDGSSAVADAAYIKESIVSPGEKILKGYADVGMPSFLGVLSDSEIESIVLYLKSLSN